MTEAEWMASADPAAMLRWLTGTVPDPPGSGIRRGAETPACARKLRLYAVACCRAVEDGSPCGTCKGTGLLGYWGVGGCPSCHGTGRAGGLTDPRSRLAVEVAERFADGMATEGDREAAYMPTESVEAARWGAPFDAANAPHRMCSWAVAMDPVAGASAIAHRCHAAVWPAAQAAILRDVFGNPFRPVRIGRQRDYAFGDAARKARLIDPAVLRWGDCTVPRMAQAIYTSREYGRMPILADALLDAGCDDEGLIAHCRGEERCTACRLGSVPTDREDDTCGACRGTCWRPLRGPHCRGCWAVDLLLGRE